MNKFFKPLLPSLIATAVIGVLWLFKGPSDQELLANDATMFVEGKESSISV